MDTKQLARNGGMTNTIKPLMSVMDTIHMGFYLSAINLTEEDFKYLDECKQRTKEEGVKACNDLIEFKGKYWHIASARKIYAFVLYNDDVTIKIARKLSNGVYPEIFVEFRSRLLMGGLNDAYWIIREWIGQWAVISAEKVSRADLATDFQGDLSIDMQNVVMRPRNNATHSEEYREGRRITGYTFGSGDILLRAYDKTHEIEKRGKQYMKAEWEKQGWDQISSVWRVEYQLRREILKEFQIETFQNLLDISPDMWNYLTKDWFSIRQPSETDTTRSRWMLSEDWQTIHESFKSFGQLTGVVREKIKQVSIEKLVPQMAGLLTSFSALCQVDKINLTDVMRSITRHYRKKGKTIQGVIEDKFRRYALFEESYMEAL